MQKKQSVVATILVGGGIVDYKNVTQNFGCDATVL